MSGAVMVTLVGWAATEPRVVVGDRVPFTSFRLACTERSFDRRANEFVDRGTEWFTVKAFRDVAQNVAASVRKGDPLLVHGRLSTQEWESDRGTRTTLVVEASAIGPDLSKGRSHFSRTVHVSRQDAGADPGSDATAASAVDAAADGDGAAGVERIAADAVAELEDPWRAEEGSVAEEEPEPVTP